MANQDNLENIDDIVDSVNLVSRVSKAGNIYKMINIKLSNGFDIEVFPAERAEMKIIEMLLTGLKAKA